MKRAWTLTLRAVSGVAPFTGAWIETKVHVLPATNAGVAPFTGAWIETATGFV